MCSVTQQHVQEETTLVRSCRQEDCIYRMLWQLFCAQNCHRCCGGGVACYRLVTSSQDPRCCCDAAHGLRLIRNARESCNPLTWWSTYNRQRQPTNQPTNATNQRADISQQKRPTKYNHTLRSEHTDPATTTTSAVIIIVTTRRSLLS